MSILKSGDRIGIWLLFVLIAAAGACVHPQGRLVTDRSFRGIPWGAGPESIDGLVLEMNQAHFKSGFRPEEDRFVGDAEADHIMYHFVEDRFSKVDLVFTGYETFLAVKKQLTRFHGHPHSASEELLIYRWIDEEIELLLRYYRLSSDQKCTLEIHHKDRS